MKNVYLTLFLAICVLSPGTALSQELVVDAQNVVLAKVISITGVEDRLVPGTEEVTSIQTIEVEILEGEERGKVVVIENDYLNLELEEKFYLMHTRDNINNTDYYSVLEPYRLSWVYFFVGLFLLCVIIFGGWQGLRGLVSLVGSLFCIVYILLPGIINGYSPILMSIGVSSLIIVVGSYITHGFNKTTTSAVIGMVITIIITGILAYFAVDLTRLSGFESEEALYLHFSTSGGIDFVGLLLGGIMIGLLGVLYDASISQAISVEELHGVAPNLPRKSIYKRAIRIGREHIGALVDTLAIAYVGASLPLLLLFYANGGDLSQTLNREIFSAEIIRTMIGSIGLIIAVPITTWIASVVLIPKAKNSPDPERIRQEEEKIKHMGHSH